LFVHTVLGALAAFAVAELALRPFATAMRADTHPPTYLTPRHELRQYQEGVATVHYFADGSRSTGERRLRSGTNLVIIGDSQVEAQQVDDVETMGAVLERRVRAEHVPLDVVQLGWGGAGIPTYVGVASQVLATWPSERVVVVLNPRDFGPGALRAGNFKLTIAPDGSTKVTHNARAASAGPIKRLLQHSALGYMLWLRGKQMWSSADEEDVGRGSTRPRTKLDILVAASVRALHEAYGDRLAIVYTPYIGVTDSPPTPDEALLLRACAEQRVPCISARDAMRAARDVDHVLCRGFSNTAPGVGHFNAGGHAVMANVIWQLVYGSQRGS
jgi:hypothetical protein